MRTLHFFLKLAVPAVIFAVAFRPSVLAQEASISGTVTDTQAIMPNVVVTLRSDATVTRSTTTDESGQFSFKRVSPGSYNLLFTRQGFEPETRVISITGGPVVVNVELRPGVISTQIAVIDVSGKETASRMDLSDRELPVQVGSVSAQVLESQGVNDLVGALRNVSGVSARRFYGIYEYYTIRGFFQSDVQLVDGMRLEGNRINTQLNNVERIEVLKGPSSILYGGQALGGAINIIRKKPQGTRAYDFTYRGGRWNCNRSPAARRARSPIACSIASIPATNTILRGAAPVRIALMFRRL